MKCPICSKEFDKRDYDGGFIECEHMSGAQYELSHRYYMAYSLSGKRVKRHTRRKESFGFRVGDKAVYLTNHYADKHSYIEIDNDLNLINVPFPYKINKQTKAKIEKLLMLI